MKPRIARLLRRAANRLDQPHSTAARMDRLLTLVDWPREPQFTTTGDGNVLYGNVSAVESGDFTVSEWRQA